MTIKSRFLIFTFAIFLLTGLFTWLSMKVLAEDIIVKWVEIYAEKQLRLDKARTLLPLIQEVNLSKEFAELPSLKRWAQQPDNQAFKHAAIQDAEAFRHRFSDNSYFIALRKNGHYFYSDSDAKEHNTNLYRYTLDQNKPEDAWFYSIIDEQLDLHLNVNPDIELGVVKLWSDVLIRDNNEILGVVGTGLDLSTVLGRMTEEQDIYSALVFTNYEGSIQLHQQENLINFASITKQSKDKKTVFQLVDEESSAQLKQSFQRAHTSPNSIEMTIVYKDDIRHLASVTYLPEIDWYQVNFIDINQFLPWTEFSDLLIVFLISLICALVVVYLLITLIITKPLEALDASITTLENNTYRPPAHQRFAGLEIKRLISNYQTMSLSFLKHQDELERQVAERTNKLNALAHTDSLTQVYNRRGFEKISTECMLDWQEKRQVFSLINVDVDKFKQVNDQYGHICGDQLLQQLALYLKTTVAERGAVARWGGDEFLILVKHTRPQDIELIYKQLRADSQSFKIQIDNQALHIKFSLGIATVQEKDTLETLYSRADTDMYTAKFAEH